MHVVYVADGEGEDGVGGEEEEASEEVARSHRSGDDEEAESKGRGDGQDFQTQLGSSREAQVSVRGESDMA